MSSVRVAVLGANGFLGGELVRLLAAHPAAKLTSLVAGRSAGQALSAVRPGLVGPADAVLESFDADRLADSADVAMLALPHGASAEAASALLDRGVRVIDLGSDFRLPDPVTHQRFYGRPAQALPHRQEAFYALPELTGGPAASVRLVANPGCFATALALMLVPLADVLDAHAILSVYGATGSTGSGIEPSAGVHHSLRSSNFTAYKPNRHQHWGEVLAMLTAAGRTPTVRFVPHSLPTPRGIHLTLTVERAHLQVADLLAHYSHRYAGKPFITLGRGVVAMGSVLHSNRAAIAVEDAGDCVVITVAIDNLLKGGSGQAIQNLNLWQGWEETLGLPIMGTWP